VRINPGSAEDRYGWVGGKRRSTDDLGGLVLMGVRLYNPATGRFLSMDPVPGGNANAYTYPLNPIDQSDLSGQFWHSIGHAIHSAASWASHHKTEIALAAAQFVPVVDDAVDLYAGFRAYRAVRAGEDAIKASESASRVAGKMWVGRGASYHPATNRYVSRDGARQYRPPTTKVRKGVSVRQSNFDTLKPTYKTQHMNH
jgi:RHS repeat-associated protein